MKAKLIEQREKTTKKNRLDEFPENTWGVIREWEAKDYIGNIVIRRGDKLQSLERILNNEIMGTFWTWDKIKGIDGHMYIEPLGPGSRIEITL